MTDTLRIITENTANIVKGTYLTKRWVELMNPEPKKKQEKPARTAQQIADDIITRLTS